MDNADQTRYAKLMTDKPEVRYLDRTTPPHISTLILLAALPALSMNMFLPSIPAMAIHFDVDYRMMQLSVSLYLAMTAVLQLLIGPLSDRYGRRPIIQIGGVIFIIATLGCILSPSAEIFLGFRMLQAVIATGMALSRAVIRDMVPEAQAASMIGYVTMGMSLSPMLGPFFGGILDTYFGWKATFWVLLVLGIMLLALSWADLGETSTTKSTSFGAQFKQYPELILSRRFWGYALSATFAAGAFFAYLGGGALCRQRAVSHEHHLDGAVLWRGFSRLSGRQFHLGAVFHENRGEPDDPVWHGHRNARNFLLSAVVLPRLWLTSCVLCLHADDWSGQWHDPAKCQRGHVVGTAQSGRICRRFGRRVTGGGRCGHRSAFRQLAHD